MADDLEMLDAIIEQCQEIMRDEKTDRETQFKAHDRLIKAISLRRKLKGGTKSGSSFDGDT